MDLVEEFFRAYRDHFAPLTVVFRESLPADLITGPPDADGYVVWELRQRAGPVDFADAERACGGGLPSSFKEWLERYEALEDFDCSLVRVVHAPPDVPLRPLFALFERYGALVEKGLIPIGFEATMDAGPVCLDRAQDFAVCFVDGSDTVPLFSSFEAMLRCLAFALVHMDASVDDFVRLDPDMPDAARRHWQGALQ